MHTPDWLPPYGATSLLAGIGSLMRAKQWKDPVTGRLVVAQMVTEGATAVGLGVAVIAFGTSYHVELPVLCGISVFAGWLGPGPIAAFVLKKLGVDTGGKS
jgi:hypothetical protein